MKHKMNPMLKTTLELGPLLVFFLAFRYYGEILIATGFLVYTTLLSLCITYLLERKLAVMPLVSGTMMVFFGAITLVNGDEYFIKIKPTIVNMIFSLLLLGGLAMGKSLLKYIFDGAFHLSEPGWRQLSVRWGLFFMFLAALNEVIWRNFPTEFWVSFKVFGMFGLTIVFAVAQLPLIKKHLIEQE